MNLATSKLPYGPLIIFIIMLVHVNGIGLKYLDCLAIHANFWYRKPGPIYNFQVQDCEIDFSTGTPVVTVACPSGMYCDQGYFDSSGECQTKIENGFPCNNGPDNPCKVGETGVDYCVDGNCVKYTNQKYEENPSGGRQYPPILLKLENSLEQVKRRYKRKKNNY